MTTKPVEVALEMGIGSGREWPIFAGSEAIVDPQRWGVLTLSSPAATPSARSESVRRIADVLFDSFEKLGIDKVNTYLFASSQVAQAPSHISRYYKLWKAWERSGYNIPHGPRADAEVKCGATDVKYIGAIEFPLRNLFLSLEATLRHDALILIVYSQANLKDIVEMLLKWPTVSLDQPLSDGLGSLIPMCISNEISVLRATGKFDDPELIVDFFGREERLTSLHENVVYVVADAMK